MRVIVFDETEAGSVKVSLLGLQVKPSKEAELVVVGATGVHPIQCETTGSGSRWKFLEVAFLSSG